MDFQIQVDRLGSAQERAQLTFRDVKGMTSVSLEITEWSTGAGEIRTVQGHLHPDIKTIELVDGVLVITKVDSETAGEERHS